MSSTAPLLLLMLGILGILGEDAQTRQAGRNLALGAPVVQSTTGYGGPAEKTVNMSTNDNVRPCSHILLENNPWWRVDLGRRYNITRVAIANRADCCAERLNGAQIRIGSSLENNGNHNRLATTIHFIPEGQTWTYQLYPMEGRYVNVYLPGKDRCLTLCEVQVFADDTEDWQSLFDKTKLQNIALKGRAAQSSLQLSGKWGGIGFAQNAIDDNRNCNMSKGSCTLTAWEKSPWWRLNLHHEYAVASVAITNRGDCCSEDLNGAEIRIGSSRENNGKNNARCATVSSIPAEQTEYFFCGRVLKGSYVTVVLPREGSLSLCEVQVFELPVFRN